MVVFCINMAFSVVVYLFPIELMLLVLKINEWFIVTVKIKQRHNEPMFM